MNWGNALLGGTFMHHQGNWPVAATRSIIVEAQKHHPILTSISDFSGNSDICRT